MRAPFPSIDNDPTLPCGVHLTGDAWRGVAGRPTGTAAGNLRPVAGVIGEAAPRRFSTDDVEDTAES